MGKNGFRVGVLCWCRRSATRECRAMSEALQLKTVEYTVRLTVSVDDSSKYDTEMGTLWGNLFSQMKEIARNYDRGTGRIQLEATKVK